jgi:hypothetical protein
MQLSEALDFHRGHIAALIAAGDKSAGEPRGLRD